MDLSDIMNQDVSGIGRASTMCCIQFGPLAKVKNFYGDEAKLGEYALHLQCPWRIRNTLDSTIIIASGDMYEPNSNMKWSEDFEWDILGNNLFDEKAEFLSEKAELLISQGIPVIVKDICIKRKSDLEIVFSNGYMLECFANTSVMNECWRIFKPAGGSHMVAYSK